MKIWVIPAAAMSVTGIAFAQMPAPTAATLQPGEILLQVAATGEDLRAADDIGVQLAVRASGATIGEAHTAVGAKVDEVTAALVAAGIGHGAITMAMGSSGSNGIDLASKMFGNNRPTAGPPKVSASATLKLKLTGAAQLHAIQPVIDSEGVNMTGTPNVALKDDQAARAAATASALAQAQKTADLQASLLHMHVVRLLRISNYGPLGDMDMLTQPFAQLLRAQHGDDSKVVTTARVYIDFAVEPGAR